MRFSRSMQTDRNWKVATDRSVLPVAVGDANWKVGLGLPLARLYAKYFGGTLHLAPMEGYGTDGYF